MTTNAAPGVYTTVTTASSSTSTGVPTGQWFVTGITQQGPIGVPIPITSMADFLNYLGPRTQETDSYSIQYNLYDALDEYFHDGGVVAYVSRVTGPRAATASTSIADSNGITSLTISAAGPGAWGNALSAVVVNSGSYYNIKIYNGTNLIVTSPNLFYAVDAQNWFNAQNSWQVQVNVVAGSGGIPVGGTYSLNGRGSDDNGEITDQQWTQALTAFTDVYGPGQVSAPGHTTPAGYAALLAHAVAFNRVALLDVADSPTASTLVAQAQTVQTNPSPDYAALLAPWIIIPGITTSNPGTASPIPNRVVPPSALAAALMAANDITSDCNNPAAGNNGQSNYAIGTTQTYVTTDRATLNGAGVDVFRTINGVVTLYGYRTLALDPNWTYLNNVRMRMQMVFDFDNIGESFVFQEIDGQGQLFSTFNGALAGRCQKYWVDGSLYGATAQQAFSVNTGPQVNTPTTIANSQVNAIVSVRLSPFGEAVNVVKYLSNATIPNTTSI